MLGSNMYFRAAVLLAIAVTGLCARHLPIQVFTSAQGLPRNSVGCLVPGPTGLLWICTSEGLARFDGYRFRVFGPSEGLPSRRIVDFVPSRKGGFWVVTDRGVCRLLPGSRIGEPCRLLPVDHPSGDFTHGGLLESSSGDTLVATTKALFRVSDHGRQLQRMAFTIPSNEFVNTLAESPAGTLLIATEKTLFEWWPGAPARNLTESIGAVGSVQMFRFSSREIWELAPEAIYRLIFKGGVPSRERQPMGESHYFSTLLRRRDGSIWAAGSALRRISRVVAVGDRRGWTPLRR